jgi:hypothetical protein
VDRPDFEIITDEQYERLRRCARESRADDYRLVLEGAVLAVGEEAMRPGEIFALHHPDLHFNENLIHVWRQIDLDTGKITWPKDDDGRWVVMSPEFRAHMERMPRMGKVIDATMGEIVFPASRGGYMFRSTWHTHWHSIRASAGMPGQDFYELKHRAIQWMIDPIEDGGLGLDPATAAEIVGHDDGGYLIATVYTKLAQRRAIARAQNERWMPTSSAATPPTPTQSGPRCTWSMRETATTAELRILGVPPCETQAASRSSNSPSAQAGRPNRSSAARNLAASRRLLRALDTDLHRLADAIEQEGTPMRPRPNRLPPVGGSDGSFRLGHDLGCQADAT